MLLPYEKAQFDGKIEGISVLAKSLKFLQKGLTHHIGSVPVVVNVIRLENIGAG